MMSKNFICCQECYNDIKKIDFFSAGTWMYLCGRRLIEGEFLTSEYQMNEDNILFNKAIKVLEKERFLVSTEVAETVVIKMPDYLLTDDGDPFFCGKESKHVRL